MSGSNWAKGKKFLKNYVIEDLLGIGGASTVYLARRLTDRALFAVKVIHSNRLNSIENQQLLFNELRTWIDLPEHPNITTCRFFKTLEDSSSENSIGIFADYVNGGSLKDWIENGKLTEPEKIIEVAIQAAYALQLAHDHGIIHQDVKPGNVLMTRDGIPRITDFGLARLTFRTTTKSPPDNNLDTYQSSTRGFTMAYCSPEQFNQSELTPATDIWSFGVMLSHMFTGQLLTQFGYLADEAFHYDFENHPNPPYQTVPNSIIQVIEKCIKRNPSDRWSSFNALIGRLHQIYYMEFGKEFRGANPNIVVSRKIAKRSHDRMTETGKSWDDPREWIERAYQQTGRDSADIDALISRHPASRTSQALKDLELYEIAMKTYQSCLNDGENIDFHDYIRMLLNKALVHEGVSDWKGSVNSRGKALKILEDLVYNQSRSDLTRLLSDALMQQGWILNRIGNTRNGLEFYEKARLLRDFMYKQNPGPELAVELSKAYAGIAEAQGKQKRFRESRINMDEAIRLLYDVIFEQKKHDYAPILAVYYQKRAFMLKSYVGTAETMEYLDKAEDIMENRVNLETENFDIYLLSEFFVKRAVVTRDFEQYDDALQHLNRAIRILERAVYMENREELRADLAGSYYQKALTLAASKNESDSLLFINEAIKILDKLVNTESREDLAENLAEAYEGKGDIFIGLGRKWDAIKLMTQATELLKWLIYTNGQQELRENLARICLKQAKIFTEQKDYLSVVHIYTPVIKIYKDLVYGESRKQYREPLARAMCEKSHALILSGNTSEAKRLARDGMLLLESLTLRSNKKDLADYRESMKKNLSRVLPAD